MLLPSIRKYLLFVITIIKYLTTIFLNGKYVQLNFFAENLAKKGSFKISAGLASVAFMD